MRIFQFALILINIGQVYLVQDLYFNSVFCLWSYLTILVLEIFQRRRVNLLIVFFTAFVYMVPAEGILNYQNLYSRWGTENVTTAIRFLIASSSAIFVGYKIGGGSILMRSWYPDRDIGANFYVNHKRSLVFILLLFTFIFFVSHFQNTIYGLLSGRGSAFPHSYSVIVYSAAYITVGLWTVIFKGNVLKTIFFSSPIILTFFATGTRFLLLFLIFILFFKELYFLKVKYLWRIVFVTIILLTTVDVVRQSRLGGIANISEIQNTTNVSGANPTLTESIVRHGSREGLIRNIAMINDYTSKNGHTYGRSIGFLAIFWIPRSVWVEKPVMLDSWLIREYETGFSSGHSSASSYGGELLMDFGFFFSCIILCFAGFMLYRLDRWILDVYNKSFRNYILSGFILGWVFFATRSLLTATFMLISMIIISKMVFWCLNRFRIVRSTSSA